MFVQQNSVSAVVDYYKVELKDLMPIEEIDSIVKIVFQYFKSWDSITLRINQSEMLSESELLLFHGVLKRLKKEEPIQYILGETEFYGLIFKVKSDVLVPRQETEELVDLIINECKGNESILDIGTGSGCIPVCLKSEMPNSQVSALDVSEKAIHIARENADLNNVKVNFFLQDILAIDKLPTKFDVIVSNPPYITEQEKKQMQKNVLEFEPHLALFVEDENPLIFYKKIAKIAIESLSVNGKIYFEINENFGKETAELLKDVGFSDIRIIKDINDKNRIVAAHV